MLRFYDVTSTQFMSFTEPSFGPQKTGDWRDRVCAEVREIWPTLTPDQQIALYAQYTEHWR